MGVTTFLPHFIAGRAEVLSEAGIESAKAEVEWILCHVLEVDRLSLYLNGTRLLDEKALGRIEEILERRATRYPLQYILGESWFYGRRFFVSPAVMVPTPETESLCKAGLGFVQSHGRDRPRILDMGTGSAVIAVTMAAELEDVSVLAVDISREALEVAGKNARNLGVSSKVRFRQSDFFSALRTDEKFDLILSNPPYIREADYQDLPPEVLADPRISLVAGDEGLDAIRVILRDGPNHLVTGGRIMFEVGLGQSDRVADLVTDDRRYRSFTCLKDLADIDRVVILACDE